MATAGHDGWRLDGVKWHVPFASSAERLLVLARTGTAPTDITLFLVDPDSAFVTAQVLAVDGGWIAGFARDF